MAPQESGQRSTFTTNQTLPFIHTKAYFHFLQSFFLSLGRTIRWECMHHMAQQSPNATPFARTAWASSSRSSERSRTKDQGTQGPAAKIVGTRGGESRSTQAAACAPGACVSHCTGTEGAAAGTDRRCFWPGSKNSGGIPRHHDKRAPLFNNVRAAARLPRSQDG